MSLSAAAPSALVTGRPGCPHKVSPDAATDCSALRGSRRLPEASSILRGPPGQGARADVGSAHAARVLRLHPGNPDAAGPTYQTDLVACGAVPPWPRPRGPWSRVPESWAWHWDWLPPHQYSLSKGTPSYSLLVARLAGSAPTNVRQPVIEIRAASSDEWRDIRDVRLLSLRDAPEAFTST